MIDKELLNLLGKNKKYIFIVVFLQILGLLFNVLITAGICAILYITLNDYEIKTYIYPSICIIISIIIRYINTRVIGSVKEKLGRNVKKELREKIYNKIILLCDKSTNGMNMAGLTQVSIEGIEQLDLYYSNYIPQFFYSMIAPFILFMICVWFDWHSSLVLLCCVPFIPLSIVAVSKYAKRIFAKYWNKYTTMGDKFLDSVLGLKELKIFNADDYKHQQMNETSEEFRKITMKVLVMQLASTTIMDLVAYGGAGLGIAIAVYESAFSTLNPIACLFICLLAVEFFLPLRAFGSAFHVAMNGASAGKKILSILNTEEPKWQDKMVSDYNIDIKNVTFSYDENRNVLEDVSMSFPNKGFMAIVGESGSGKSTIVNMIMGSLRPNKGEVMIGNTSINELSRENYYSHISVVSYNTYIFNETVRENFLMASPYIKDEEIYNALELVNLKDFILNNGGLDKLIIEDANNLSGGERQRLALAINLVANKDIYIFDEATSNIDVESEIIIMNNIKKLSLNKLVIVISHRLLNVIDANYIYYMKNGRVSECGNHKQLLKIDGGYKNMYTTQKQLEEGYLL